MLKIYFRAAVVCLSAETPPKNDRSGNGRLPNDFVRDQVAGDLMITVKKSDNIEIKFGLKEAGFL